MNKRLYRSRKEKMIGGVAGGIAEYFEVDPVIVRLAFVLLFFAGALSFLVYIVCMIVIPKEPYYQAYPPPPQEGAPQQSPEGTPVNPTQAIYEQQETSSPKRGVFGIILVVFGVLMLAQNLVPLFHHIEVLPIIFILIGVWLILGNHQKGNVQ
jgi:phage shock protein PspC (stress-responsive transcriptional regulator)